MWKKVLFGQLAGALIATLPVLAAAAFVGDDHRDFLILVALCSLLLSAVVAWIFAGKITRNVAVLHAAATQVRSGRIDSSVSIRLVEASDETQQVADALMFLLNESRRLSESVRGSARRLNDSAGGLHTLVGEMRANTDSLVASTGEIAQAAERQRGRYNRARDDMNAMARSIGETASISKEVQRAAVAAAEAAAAGSRAAMQAVERIREVFERIEQSGAQVVRFGEKSRQIDRMSGVITHIAKQTHLLALNASIEAARAGAEGRGFGVVAEEVRKLANSVAGSAEQIAQLVDEIRTESAGALSALDQGTRHLAAGREDLAVMMRTLEHLVDKVRENARTIEPLGDNAMNQLEAADQIVSRMDEISADASKAASIALQAAEASKQYVERMAEVAGSAERLQGLSRDLDTAAGRFQV